MDATDSRDNCDLTFISIHDLSPEARILYSSDSIVDVLGYTPDEVVNRSCWEFFPLEEIPYAKHVHRRGIAMDRAAMLAYCRVKDKTGHWVGCECCFTVVYDVMVVCTSIYRSGLPSQKRAAEAPVIRRLFSSSPRDPRYHMLSHISQKFSRPFEPEAHEPRAALFLNRFTRTLTIMYATSGLEDVIGISAAVMTGKSFYYCIAENCLQDAVKCLETAKGNNSIAYLRFWFRDPRAEDPPPANRGDSDEEMTTTESSVDQDVGGGVHLGPPSYQGTSSDTSSRILRSDSSSMDVDSDPREPGSRTWSGDSSKPSDTHEAIFGGTARQGISDTPQSLPPTPDARRRHHHHPIDPIELEAVISCASDGLVVCLRKARPMIPPPTRRPSRPVYENGLFAAPWGREPMVPPMEPGPQYGLASNFAPALGPQPPQKQARPPGHDSTDFMSAIREQAIFAWAITGINGSLQKFSSGTPSGESLPPEGLPVWQSDYNDPTTLDGASKSGGSSGGLVDKNRRTDSASAGTDGDAKKVVYPGPPTGVFGDPGLANNRPSKNRSGTGIRQ